MSAKARGAESGTTATPELRRAYVNPNLSSARMFVSSVVAIVVHLAFIGGAALAGSGQRTQGANVLISEITVDVLPHAPTPSPPQSKQPGSRSGQPGKTGQPSPQGAPALVRQGKSAPVVRSLAPGPDVEEPRVVVPDGVSIGSHLDNPGSVEAKPIVVSGCGRVYDSEALFTLKQRMQGASSCTATWAGSTYTVHVDSGTISPSRGTNKCAPSAQAAAILRSCR